MDEFNEANAIEAMRDKINKNGFDPETVSAVQKSKDAFLVTVDFGDEDGARQGVITRDHVAEFMRGN